MAIFGGLSKYSNFGLLVIRLGLGVMMIMHGYPKLIGGPAKWEDIGGVMSNLGLQHYHAFWGFMAAFAEGVGGLLILLGLFFRPAALLLAFTMAMAATEHITSGDGIMGASHAIEVGFVFLGLFFVGPGRFSVDKG